jgi:uncharacterized protein (TIGR03083 family)
MGTWDMIAAERASLVDALGDLPEESWDKPTLCPAWTVRDVVGHITAAAYQTKASFFGKMIASGFNFNKFADKDAHKYTVGKSTKEIIEALRARINTRNSPPGPTPTWLGEVIIHTEDIYRALGTPGPTHPTEHVVVVADFYKGSNLIIGAKKRIAGLTLRATDAQWSTGAGPEVSGPVLSLVLAMTGRPSAIDDLSGEGVATLRGRP